MAHRSKVAYGKMGKLFIIFLLLPISLLLWACAGPPTSGGSAITAQVAQGVKEQKKEDFNREIVIAAKLKEPEYRLGTGDVIQVSVFGIDELKDMEGEINAKGFVSLPLVKDVKVGGLTLAQAEDEITKAYKKYVINPKVTARVKEYVSYRVSVLGEVEKPDVYALTGGRTVLDVIARAGGLTDNASKTVTLVRPGDKENINYVIDLERLVTTQDPKINMILKPGDVVYVPKAGSIFVDGFVNQPGAFPLTSKITVTQAIAMAGGTAPEANTSSVYVYRLTENGDRKPLKVSLNDIREGKIGDPYLEENDVVLVTGSGFKRFVSGFLKFFGIGFSSASGASSYKVGIGK